MKEAGIAIVGGTGYGAAELLRLFVNHPSADVVSIVSSSMAGHEIQKTHPHLRSFYPGVFDGELDFGKLKSFSKKAVFFALPHGTSAKTIVGLAEQCSKEGVCVIDLSGDFRLKSESTHSSYYPDSPFCAALRNSFTYGVPELAAEKIQSSKLISNPGCLATASILALAPIVRYAAETPIVINAATGSSGSGKEAKATTHHPVRHANITAYKPLSHQHEPEIAQVLNEVSASEIEIAFTPQSLPVTRGIFVTANLLLKDPMEKADLVKLYSSFYQSAPFVRVLEAVSPELQNVVGSNFCDIAVSQRGKNVVVMSAIDNLIKGMAGQAIQNMNLMFGIPETTGLWNPALRPC